VEPTKKLGRLRKKIVDFIY